MSDRLEAAGDAFAALADPHRRRLLELIAASDGATATSLAPALPISRQAIVKHLVRLEQANLVVSRRQGRETIYRVRPQRLRAVAEEIEAAAAAWDNVLLQIKERAEASDDATSEDTAPEERDEPK